MVNRVKAFAPVNIAWIKYMGKIDGRPSNASLSMTLDQLGTVTSMTVASADSLLGSPAREGGLRFLWNNEAYVPPEAGRIKAERFLNRIEDFTAVLKKFGISASIPTEPIEIKTENNIPASAGIASSASGFAALTLAWLGILSGEKYSEWKHLFLTNTEVKKAVAALAALGSGSACRSFMGPFVEWDPKLGIRALPDHSDSSNPQWIDFILLLETAPKKVSSSEAHERVKTSVLFSGRAHLAEERLAHLKNALSRLDYEALSELVLNEAIDMHELFHTSEPSFTYLNEESRRWIDRVRTQNPKLPSQNVLLTLDAGANVHLFVPGSDEKIWDRYLTKESIHYLKARQGRGANYVD